MIEVTPYHQGIAARKAGEGRHANPYKGKSIGFFDYLLNPRCFSNNDDDLESWDYGWDCEDAYQRRIGK